MIHSLFILALYQSRMLVPFGRALYACRGCGCRRARGRLKALPGLPDRTQAHIAYGALRTILRDCPIGGM